MNRWATLFSDLTQCQNAKIAETPEAQVYPGPGATTPDDANNAKIAKTTGRSGEAEGFGNFGGFGTGEPESLKPASDKASTDFGNFGILAFGKRAGESAPANDLHAVADLLRAVHAHEYGRQPGPLPGSWWTDGRGTLFCRWPDGGVQQFGAAQTEALLALPLPPSAREVLAADLTYRDTAAPPPPPAPPPPATPWHDMPFGPERGRALAHPARRSGLPEFTRRLVGERAGMKCEDCGIGGRLDLHHLHYDSVGRELPEDLALLCRECHPQRHRSIFDGHSMNDPTEENELRESYYRAMEEG